ncbi:MAG: hypothetical protein ABR573_00885 [Candidatus Dormibacteria bacterium]
MSRAAKADISVIVVVFRNRGLDLGWLPEGVPLLIVHNDDRLDRESIRRTGVLDLHPGRNVGFGAGVNLALKEVHTSRVLICNPDTHLRPDHFAAMSTGLEREVIVVPIRDAEGRPTSIVSRYPTSLSMAVGGLRPGRLFPRGGLARRLLSAGLGNWGRSNERLMLAEKGEWSLSAHWFSGAVFSIATDRIRAVNGFDERYFLYMEDVDLAERLNRKFPDMTIRMAPTPPGVHDVGGSGMADAERTARTARLLSMRVYSAHKRGFDWSATTNVLRVLAYLDGWRSG